MSIKKLSHTATPGKVCFLILSLSLLVGFYLNEDASAGGASADFYETWGHVLALKENLFIDGTEWSMHFPLHHIILSRLNFLIEDRYLLRLFFCIISISVPFLFYLNLKLKFSNIDKNILWFLASLILLLPSFRYSAIWANDHITGFIFFLLSTLFFLKWEKEKNYEILNLNIIFQVIFLALAVYCRQYYALLFLYFMIIFFQKLKFNSFIKISIFVLFLALPGIWMSYRQPVLLYTIYSFKYYNGLIIIPSIISFYLIPIVACLFLNNKIQLNERKKSLFIGTIFFTLFVLILSIPFDYNYLIGGGFFTKLSFLIFNNKLLLYITAIIGFVFLTYLSLENKNNLILFLLLLFGLNGSYIFQKYFEPTFLILFFLIIISKLPLEFLKNYRNLFYLYIYTFIYLISAIINDILQLTKNI
tara:strand:- start:2710 stop:3963 length:1254 start_codon:yes stop_codon:yes gene_type:complete